VIDPRTTLAAEIRRRSKTSLLGGVKLSRIEAGMAAEALERVEQLEKYGARRLVRIK
jgi:hypothetical protein